MCDFFDFGPGGDSGEYSGETGGESSGETVDSATETGGHISFRPRIYSSMRYFVPSFMAWPVLGAK